MGNGRRSIWTTRRRLCRRDCGSEEEQRSWRLRIVTPTLDPRSSRRWTHPSSEHGCLPTRPRSSAARAADQGFQTCSPGRCEGCGAAHPGCEFGRWGLQSIMAGRSRRDRLSAARARRTAGREGGVDAVTRTLSLSLDTFRDDGKSSSLVAARASSCCLPRTADADGATESCRKHAGEFLAVTCCIRSRSKGRRDDSLSELTYVRSSNLDSGGHDINHRRSDSLLDNAGGRRFHLARHLMPNHANSTLRIGGSCHGPDAVTARPRR